MFDYHDSIRAAESYRIHSKYMALAKAFEYIEDRNWTAVQDMLLQGSLFTAADFEEHHVRY